MVVRSTGMGGDRAQKRAEAYCPYGHLRCHFPLRETHPLFGARCMKDSSSTMEEFILPAKIRGQDEFLLKTL